MSQHDIALAVIGGGNMAQAIVSGALRSGVIRSERVVIAEPDEAKREIWGQWGVGVVGSASRAMLDLEGIEGEPGSGQILLAIKPQVLPEVAPALAESLAVTDRVVVSILAGATSETVRAALGGGGRVIRVMPNLPARVGKGTTAIALGAGAKEGDDDAALALFRAVGEVVTLDESLMDAFTAIAGSGPAYVFLLAEAMVEGAVRVGLDPGTADRIVRSTVVGAAELLTQADESAGDLRRAVTSKGGTTAAALDVFEERDLKGIAARAIEAARERGAELAKLASKNAE